MRPTGPARLTADIALAARGTGIVDISARPDADVAFAPADELPFVDRALGSIVMGDAVASLSVREQVQLLLECRRVLEPGASILLVEAHAVQTQRCLAASADLAGLLALPSSSMEPGWSKPGDVAAEPEPLVSILIPAWNPRYFAECLDSAIAQTYRRTEIVVCDDSDGETIAAIVASRSAKADIRYSKNASRLQQRGNYSRCLTLARGEFIKFLNDDDVLAPDCVSELASAFVQAPGLALATSHRQVIDAHSQPMDDMPATRAVVDRDLVINGQSLANAMIMYGLNFIGEPTTALFRKRDIEPRAGTAADGPFHFNGKEIRGLIDFTLWARLLLRGNAAFLNARLSSFRRHGEQAQAQPEVVARNVEGIRALQREWITLGLFRLMPPHLVYGRPLSRAAEDEDEWQLTPLPWFAGARKSPEQALDQWRSIERHPFDVA